MANDLLTQSPFAVLTFIAAPVILTNAASVLAMSTINRMLRTRDRMHQMFAESEDPAHLRGPNFMDQVSRVERQAVMLLSAMRSIYVALGAFAASAFVTLLGAVLGQLSFLLLMRTMVGISLLLGFFGVGGLVLGCVHLFRATQLSLFNIQEEAGVIRTRMEQQKILSSK
jgi:hypothetical protein